MSKHALEVLEFGRVLERVARCASTDLGRIRVLQLRPRTDRDEIVRELARVAAALRFQEERPEWGLGPIPDVKESLGQLAVEGAVCEPLELYRMGELISTSRLLRLELLSREGRFPELQTIIESLVDLPAVEETIRRSVDSEGQVLSSASRELKRTRDGLRGAHSKIVRKLESYLGTLPERFVVPDASVTIREGRYVIPVRREGRAEVGGIIYDESQTGATLYLEPPISLELMNRVRDLEREEAREIRRILGELTAGLSPEHHAVLGALDALVDFDALDARARAARAWKAEAPQFTGTEERGFTIREGRHPLLLEGEDADRVIPFDLDLSADEYAMVVSGPNTGGKSVFLKAVGLTSALAQSGVVPAVGPGTRLPVFGSFFADIGDEQSIARNLSTFSAHLANLADLVEEADGTSLVLIDEMGTGTDPAEGAALARSVIEELVARGATTLVSSHLGELKRLDTEGSGVVNASLQFDSERMEPTYRLVKGRPGRSFGIAIARRLGFPGDVLDRAESYREEGGVELDDVLERLERQEEEVRTLVAELELERTTAERLRSEVEGRKHSLEEAERTAEERAQEDARKLLLEARAEVEEAIRELRGAWKEGAEVEEAAREARRRVEQAANRHRRSRGHKPTRKGRVGVAAGDPVRIESTGSRGKVLEVRDERVLVESGAMRIEVPLVDLTPLDRKGGEASTPPKRGDWSGYPARAARTEVDLRGMRVDDMDQELARAVDEAVVGGLGELRIIHGKGTGALRARVAELLAEDRRVRDFRTGGPAEGATGVTVAIFG